VTRASGLRASTAHQVKDGRGDAVALMRQVQSVDQDQFRPSQIGRQGLVLDNPVSPDMACPSRRDRIGKKPQVAG